MAVSSSIPGEERARRRGALPVHFQGHHGPQAAHRGRLQRWENELRRVTFIPDSVHACMPLYSTLFCRGSEQVCQIGSFGDQVSLGAGVAALEPGHAQGQHQAIQSDTGEAPSSTSGRARTVAPTFVRFCIKTRARVRACVFMTCTAIHFCQDLERKRTLFFLFSVSSLVTFFLPPRRSKFTGERALQKAFQDVDSQAELSFPLKCLLRHVVSYRFKTQTVGPKSVDDAFRTLSSDGCRAASGEVQKSMILCKTSYL